MRATTLWLVTSGIDEVADLLAEDVRTTMPPFPEWFAGRDAVLAALAASWDPDRPGYVGRFRLLPTRANGRPAVAAYVRPGGEPEFRRLRPPGEPAGAGR